MRRAFVWRVIAAYALCRIFSVVLLSAALWSAAFGLYFVRYWPILTRPRVRLLAGLGSVCKTFASA